jgi:hypothetical protein
MTEQIEQDHRTATVETILETHRAIEAAGAKIRDCHQQLEDARKARQEAYTEAKNAERLWRPEWGSLPGGGR